MGALNTEKMKKTDNKMFMLRLTGEQYNLLLAWVKRQKDNGLAADGRSYFVEMQKAFHDQFMELSR